MANKRANSEAERAISAIAARRHGIVTRTQLLAAGILPSGITVASKPAASIASTAASTR
jgi:hypothetical protein